MDEQKYRNMAAQLRKPEGDDGIKTGEWMNKGNEQINLDTLDVLNADSGDCILEIGMGNGFFVKNILEKHPTITYTGCDFSGTMIAEAKKINADAVAKGRAKFILSAVNSLSVTAKSFNKIFTVNTLYFWEDKSKILNEIKRLLKPNGELIIAIRPKHQMEKYPFTKYGFELFSKEEVIQLLTGNGFTISAIKEIREPDFELENKTVKMENIIFKAMVF